MSIRRRVLFLTPRGVGGIASFSQAVRTHWNLRNPGIVLWKVPRSNLLGWISYFPWLLIYLIYLVFFRPSVVHVNLASKGSPVRKLPFVLLAKALGIPIVTQLHSGKFDQDFLSASKKAVWKFISNLILVFSTKVIFINQKQMQNLINHGAVAASKATFLPNHVYLPAVWNIEQPQNVYDAVFIGRVSKEKGALDLLEAIRRLDATPREFAFVGEMLIDGYSSKTSEKINNHGVTFFGELSHFEAMKVLNESKLLILPSHSENFPMVILESFARGKPVISTRVGEIENIVSDFKDGRLFGVEQIEDLSKAIGYYLERPDQIRSDGERGRKKAEQLYDIRHYPKKLVQIYLSTSKRDF